MADYAHFDGSAVRTYVPVLVDKAARSKLTAQPALADGTADIAGNHGGP